MKKVNTNKKLSFEKFQIAKLNNLHNIIGGKANNNLTNAEEEENQENQSGTTDTWTTITTTTNTNGG